MRLFDLHCDTLYKVHFENLSVNSDKLSVTPNKTEYLDKFSQLMAIWIPDSIRGEHALELFKSCAEIYERLYKPLISNNRNYLLTVENGSVINGDVSNIITLCNYGVKAVTIVYNEDNELGSGALSSSKFGLTKLGKTAVKAFEDSSIFIDLSHSSVRTFYDVAEIKTKPIIATHSNSYSVCKHKRNLTDEQFGIIKDSGGVVGINFYPPFLKEDSDNAGLIDVIKHIEHFLSLGGDNTVCIGSDFDGCDALYSLNGVDKMPILYESLLKLGYSEQLVQKIFYDNAHNFFT